MFIVQWDALVGAINPYAIPTAVRLGCCFNPCYECCDATGCSCVSNNPRRPSATSVPVVLFASRTVKDVDAYRSAFTSYAYTAMTGRGVRACFSFVDRNKHNTVLQFMWVDTAGDYPAQPP